MVLFSSIPLNIFLPYFHSASQLILVTTATAGGSLLFSCLCQQREHPFWLQFVATLRTCWRMYFLQAQMMRKYTQNDKHQVCPAYLLLCSIFLHESVFTACFLSLSAALISLGDSSSPPVCFLRRRTNVNNTINFLSLETTFRNKQRKLHCKREKYFLW